MYLYDFGDSWERDIDVLGPGAEPGLVEGSGARPPEDCGGAPGYEHLLRVLADPRHEQYARSRQWMQAGPSALTLLPRVAQLARWLSSEG